jgi:Double zinc ribbon
MTWLGAPIILGAVAAAAGLAFVLLPMFMGSSPSAGRRPRTDRSAGASDESTRSIEALREIEFDRETGKLSDADYASLKASYTASALSEMRGEGDVASGGGRSATSMALGPPTVCPSCGPRPEPEALFCSQCARYLPGNCQTCGAPVAEPGARYCAECGHRLAA